MVKGLRGIATVACFSAVMVSPKGPAQAQPFELYAKYKAPDGNKQETSLKLSADDLVPVSLDGENRVAIYLRGKSDDVSKAMLASVSELVVKSSCDAHNCSVPSAWQTRNVPVPADLKLDGQILGGQMSLPARGGLITVVVSARFNGDFLCSQELEVRDPKKLVPDWKKVLLKVVKKPAVQQAPGGDKEKEKPGNGGTPGQKAPIGGKITPPPPKTAEPAAMTTAEVLDSLEPEGLQAVSLMSRSVGGATAPVLYSFCAEKAGIDPIDWEAAAKVENTDPKPPGQSITAADLRERHKKALANAIKEHLKSKHGFQDVAYTEGAVGKPTDMSVSFTQSFVVTKDLEQVFTVEEVDGSQHRQLANVVDQASHLRLASARNCGPNRTCLQLLRKHIAVKLTGKDKNGNSVNRELVPSASGFGLPLELSDFLGSSVSIELDYKHDGELYPLRSFSTTVENLGLITSFPVVSEIASLTSEGTRNEKNPKDLEFKSSIPLSWAYNSNRADGKHFAITLPWMIGFNPRSAPRFAQVVRVYPHVSVVFPTSAEAETKQSGEGSKGKAQIAVGAGVFLANAFAFSWAKGTDENGANYILMGVSVPDLVKAFQ